MSWLRRDGKKTRRAKGPVVRLEGVDAEAQKARRRAWLVKAAIFFGLVILTMAAFVRQSVFEDTVQVGDVWRQDNLSAPFVFAIVKAPEIREAERRGIRMSTPPIFHEDPERTTQAQLRKDSLSARVERALEARARYQANVQRGRAEEASRDSIAFQVLRQATGLPLSTAQWRLLSQSYNERVPGLSTTSRAPQTDARLDVRLIIEVWPIVQQLLRNGVLDVPHDSVRAQQLIVRNRLTRLEEPRPAASVVDLVEAHRVARESLGMSFPGQADTVAIAVSFFGRVLEPSLVYDASATRARWRLAEAEMSPSAGRVQVNEVIVRRGDVITEEIQQKIISLGRALSERSGQRLAWQTGLGQLMLTLAIFVWFFLYLYLLRRSIFDENRMVLMISLLFALVIVMFGAALRIPGLDMYMVPVAIAAVLLTVIFDSRVAIFGLLSLASLGSVLLNMDLVYGLGTLFAGTLGVFSVRDIRNRGQFFLSAGVVFLGYGIILLAAFLLESTSLARFLNQLLFVGVNAVLVLLAYGFLWVFERTFGLTTDVTLLELSDTNRPVLKELSLRAPGTFNHTLQVANLAEAAASAIGANPLLTRVGALYHDIGKMEKPEYFVENQRSGMNPHDQLKPRMSALIIVSHVKEGLALGERHGLPDAVTKFVPMHHGNTRVEYFYRRALELAEDEDDVMESDFRYPGPKPDSKESAILMLADSVEAASRTLESPTHKKLKGMIDGLVDSRVADHQLDNTDLTFQDLRKIKETFLNLLVGQFHARVKYPDEEKGPEPAAQDEEGLSENGMDQPEPAHRE